MTNKYLTGIGSRETPPETILDINAICQNAVNQGYILRSGGAEGADKYFEQAFDKYGGRKEIYLPWKNFNSNPSKLYKILPEAFEIAKQIHPAWEKCSDAARKLHARNIHQVLGKDLKTPSDIVYAWTQNGEDVGGTRTAIILARQKNIKVINLWKRIEDQLVF